MAPGFREITMPCHPATRRLWLIATALAALPALAQEGSFPERPIRIVVPFPPGGANDTVTRIVAERLSARFGQPVVVENKPGAAGNIGAEAVARANPDGYTLLASAPPPLVINHSLYPQLGFDPTRFVPITVMVAAPNVLVVHPRVAATNATEFIALAVQQPGRLNYASTGSGGTPHLSFEWFNSLAGIRVTHVPYKGAQAYPAVLSGEVDAMFMNLSDALPHLRSGKLKALAVASDREVAALPGVRPLSQVLPGFVSLTWFGLAAPPDTPSALADKLAVATAEALRHPETARRLAELQLQPVGESPARTAAFFSEEAERWRTVIRSAHIQPD
jgi:tripartite-type tricarboxylate transporter receptor subunit TctC